ncbi:hypothetical protein BOX15_Mlig020441g1 [Macrostomum lignano]|uniref:RING-type domain-containing protein n=1 Tax=Macrostomum lignano TaxID=282301 RepID=A0A267E6J1_9PLAT|nr:hypothetical protein BOX15_Mlig020441g1 [Macrostomum lignano]
MPSLSTLKERVIALKRKQNSKLGPLTASHRKSDFRRINIEVFLQEEEPQYKENELFLQRLREYRSSRNKLHHLEETVRTQTRFNQERRAEEEEADNIRFQEADPPLPNHPPVESPALTNLPPPPTTWLQPPTQLAASQPGPSQPPIQPKAEPMVTDWSNSGGLCPYCQHEPQDPVFTTCCRGVFCNQCLTTALAQGEQTCPLCRSPREQV